MLPHRIHRMIEPSSYTRIIPAQIESTKSEAHRLDITSVTGIVTLACVVVSLHEYRAILSPCEKLPTELNQTIIRLCVSPRMCFPLENGRHDPHLQITRIYSPWRMIAFSMSTLWSFNFYRGVILRSFIELAKSLLSHDPTTLVSLAITKERRPTFPEALYEDQNTVELEEAVVEFVLPNSRRLTSLEMIIEVSEWNIIIPLNFENLISLKLLLRYPLQFATNRNKGGPPVYAPSLRFVEINTNWSLWAGRNICNSWFPPVPAWFAPKRSFDHVM